MSMYLKGSLCQPSSWQLKEWHEEKVADSEVIRQAVKIMAWREADREGAVGAA